MHTQTMPADRLITADEIGPATLKLLLNEEEDTFRAAGILNCPVLSLIIYRVYSFMFTSTH